MQSEALAVPDLMMHRLRTAENVLIVNSDKDDILQFSLLLPLNTSINQNCVWKMIGSGKTFGGVRGCNAENHVLARTISAQNARCQRWWYPKEIDTTDGWWHKNNSSCSSWAPSRNENMAAVARRRQQHRIPTPFLHAVFRLFVNFFHFFYLFLTTNS